VLPGNPRQARTNYRCSDQGLAGFACRTSTAPDSGERQTRATALRNAYFTRCEAGVAGLYPTKNLPAIKRQWYRTDILDYGHPGNRARS